MTASKKVFFGMCGITVLAAGLVVATVVFGDSFLSKQSDKLVGLKLENEIIETQATSLAQAKKDIEKYSELESIAKQIVPQDKDQARATREIINIAEQAGVKIATIGFPASTLGQAAAKPAAPATGTDGATATPAPAPTTETQVKKVEGIQNLYQLDITVTSDTTSPASYARLIDFLSRLEQNRRTAQVSQISIQPDVIKRTSLNFSLTVTLYIKP